MVTARKREKKMTERRSTPASTSALGPAAHQRRENGEVRMAAGRPIDLLRQAPQLLLRQSVRNGFNCMKRGEKRKNNTVLGCYDLWRSYFFSLSML
ncbi:hypothetical protein MRB53_022189 [Persea americana]|uniref:Uncharacterized protein n=1 Tax=Persea americana TaxID=3435 RepID=A0ACC2L6R7_PERAE|nr:hypothetical protein MRB53_022189 [Persea americana]